MSLVRRHRFKQYPAMDPGTQGDLWQRGADPGILSALSGPAGHDGYVLSWNDTTGLWEARAPSGGGGSLATLSDVDLTSPASGDALQFNGTLWVNTASLDANARVGVRKNSAGSTFKRRRVNLIEGSGVTLTVADDSTDEEVDVTVAAAGGSGPGGTVAPWLAYHPFNPPSSPDSHNDEFDSSTLDASWTETVTGSPTHDLDTTLRSHLYVRINSNGDKYSITKTAPDATADFSISALFYHTAQQSIGSDQVLLFARASGSDGIFAKWANGNVTLMSWDSGSFTDRASSAWDRNTFGLLHVQRTGNVWSVYMSQDGKAFRLAGGTTFTKSFTVATVGLQIQGDSGITIYGAGLPRAVDFFRYKWKTL